MYVALNSLFDLLLRPMRTWPAEAGCAVASVVVGLLLMLAFKYVSFQERIEAVKDRMTACVLGVWLYRDQPRMILRSQVAAFVHGLHYLGLSLIPLAIMALPMVLVLAQMNAYYAHVPIAPGHETIVTLTYSDERPIDRMDARMNAPEGARVTAVSRAPHLRQVSWKVTADAPGIHPLTIAADGMELTKQLSVGREVIRVEPDRLTASLWSQLLYPSEPAFSADVKVASIHVAYPERDLWLIWEMHWLIYCFVVMLIGILAFRGPLGVAI